MAISTALRGSAILLALVGLSGCGGSTSPTAPSNPAVSLIGTVTAQGGARLSGATVRIDDGVNAGKSTTTSESGEYRIDGLAAGNGNVSAVADGYEPMIAGRYVDGRQPLNFTLRTSAPWSRAGIGPAVFDMPAYVTQIHVAGVYTGVRADFRVEADGCLILDQALGTGVLTDMEGVTYPLQTRHDGTHTIPARPSVPGRSTVPVEILDSRGGVSWSITEVRDGNAVTGPCFFY